MRGRKCRAFIFVLVVLAALALSAFFVGGGAVASGWYIQVVDFATQYGCDLNQLGLDTSLDFGPGDVPNISYYDETNGDLKYATWDPGAGQWLIQKVDTRGKVGRYTSIDVSGNVYISYYDESNKDLKLASRIAGVWQTEVADNGGGSSRTRTVEEEERDHYTGDVGKFTSMQIGSDGKARISYYNDTTDDLKFAVRVGSGGNCGSGKWQCTTVDSNGSVGKFTSLALDAGDKGHISYYDETNGNLKYASEVASGGNCGGGKWQCDTIDDSPNNVGRFTSIALNASGEPQISYVDETNGDLRYICRASGVWSKSIIYGDGPGPMRAAEGTSLKIGSDGRPRVSFHTETGEDLMFAVRTDVCGQPGTWQIQAVDTIGNQGEDNSLALKSDNSPCISYHDETNGNLKYACQVSSPPTVENVQPAGWITTTDTNVSADYTDNSGSGINLASVAVYVDGNKLTGCTTTQTGVTCTDSGLSQGNHIIQVMVADNTGNLGGGSGTFDVDSIAPAVSNVQPSGDVSIQPGPPTISADYSDTGTGIDTGSVVLTLDGAALAGCAVTSTGVSCPAPPLGLGTHTIGGSVSDNVGNISPINGGFNITCAPGKPQLTLTCPTGSDAFWGSYGDYLLRELSVRYTLGNAGASNAYDVRITGSSNSGGVTLSTSTPHSVGNIGSGGSTGVTLTYHVPTGVFGFTSRTTASALDECNTGYSYPS